MPPSPLYNASSLYNIFILLQIIAIFKVNIVSILFCIYARIRIVKGDDMIWRYVCSHYVH